MNSLEDTLEYQEAITATSVDWPEASIGFSRKETVPTIASLSRQLNTILFTVIKLRQEVAELRKERAQPAQNISQLTEQLNKLHVSPQGATFAKSKGTIKVYRNPFDVLKEISK